MEKRKWSNIQAIEGEIIRLREEGKTRQEIADRLGLEKKQIKNWVNRYNRKGQGKVAGFRKTRGRKPAKTLAEYKYENKRLKMENELLRDFLWLTGRGCGQG